jgi:hypothetical protein
MLHADYPLHDRVHFGPYKSLLDRFVFVTAFDDDKTRSVARRDGLDVLDKPVDEALLLKRVRELAEET